MHTHLSFKPGVSKIFFVKDLMVDIFGFVGHPTSVVTTHLYHRSQIQL